jgi:hypothetical protein
MWSLSYEPLVLLEMASWCGSTRIAVHATQVQNVVVLQCAGWEASKSFIRWNRDEVPLLWYDAMPNVTFGIGR